MTDKALFSAPGLLGGALWRSKRVGILGGSFNPPHIGHRHISLIALRRLKLDAVWWLVSPCNPLKSPDHLPSIRERMEQCRAVSAHPRIVVSGLENDFGTRRTRDTLNVLRRRFPGTDFVWICGFDNAVIFHKWEGWRDLLRKDRFAFIARPPAESLIQRVPASRAPGQTVWIRNVPTLSISSSDLRRRAGLPRI